MNRIKDFFYDKNDIIVAVIILIAAAVVIYMRVDKIMDYPETLLSSSAAQETVQQETEPADPSSQQQAGQDTDMKSIEIADTPVAATVAKQLEAAGVVSSAKEFEADLAKYKMSNRIQPGTYQFPANMTNEQVIEVITGEKL